MAIRKFTLTPAEVVALQAAESTTRKARDLKRLQAVRLYGTGYPVETIRALVGGSWRSLMEWCQVYREGGIERLQSHWQGDNALKLSRAQRAELTAKLHQYRPDQVLAPKQRNVDLDGNVLFNAQASCPYLTFPYTRLSFEPGYYEKNSLRKDGGTGVLNW